MYPSDTNVELICDGAIKAIYRMNELLKIATHLEMNRHRRWGQSRVRDRDGWGG